jgi:hydroxymethylpyrimidine pyrophosphatase-like HAD family hydrolase
MQTNLNLHISSLTKDHLKNIKLIAFDCDGVTVEKGTEINEKNGQITIITKTISPNLLLKLQNLSSQIPLMFTSGRRLSYLQKMYAGLLDQNVSLQSEIGMFTYYHDNVSQNYHFTPYEQDSIRHIRFELESLRVRPEFEGFEPKDQLITLHCHQYLSDVETIVRRHDPQEQLYCWWNGEAFDIGSKLCNKGTGLLSFTQTLGISMDSVMTVGNGINDKNMTNIVGIDISTDPKHLSADFQVTGEHLGGEIVIDKILSLI